MGNLIKIIFPGGPLAAWEGGGGTPLGMSGAKGYFGGLWNRGLELGLRNITNHTLFYNAG